MDTFLIKAAQLILSLCILVTLHECGHFFFSKLFRVRVEKFYLFFNPYFHLFSTKDKWFARLCPRSKKWQTEYGVGWIPLGGYVKIAGMIDESMDLEQMKKPAQVWEFRSKPAWQRLLIMVGGVLVNFLLALFLYAAILFTWGKDSLPMERIKMGFVFNETAKAVGFQNGDVPLEADGQCLAEWNYGTVMRAIAEAQTVTVMRNGEKKVLTMPDDLDMLQLVKERPPFLAPFVPSVVDSVLVGSPAYKAGMRTGARLLAVEGKTIASWNEFDELMARKNDILAVDCTPQDSARLRSLPVVFQNQGAEPDTVTLLLTSDYRLGIVKQSILHHYPLQHTDYGLLSSIPEGIKYGINVLVGYVSDLKYLFSAEGAKSVGSFGTIGSIFPATWDWQGFWGITAFLSIMLAFMNILPIPALDGGHVLFLLAEIVTGRQPSEKFLERAQMVGMLLLLGLMLLAGYNDIVKFFF